MAQYLREAKACEEAAERAKAESSEYRRKAKELLENAMTEVAMLRDHDGETDVGRGEGGDEDDIIE